MKPIKDHPSAINYHGDRPGIEPLPVLRQDMEGAAVLTSCWRLTWRERLAALVGGRVWLQVLGQAQPPVAIGTERPYAMPDSSSLRWFNLSSPLIRIGRRRIRLWNLFNRCALEAHWWGFGVLQIGNRHLLYAGHD
ncbi:MAG TPA: hypothetical protein VNM48_01735, partial [Chloroflexota bacterium]|nr:hypothetical protein [Chloroflexota bacterium]